MQLHGSVSSGICFGSFNGFESNISVKCHDFSLLNEIMCLVGLGAKFVGNWQCMILLTVGCLMILPVISCGRMCIITYIFTCYKV